MYKSAVAGYVKTVQPTASNGFTQELNLGNSHLWVDESGELIDSPDKKSAALPSGLANLGSITANISYLKDATEIPVISFQWMYPAGTEVWNRYGNIQVTGTINVDLLEYLFSMGITESRSNFTVSFSVSNEVGEEIPLISNVILQFRFVYYSANLNQVRLVHVQINNGQNVRINDDGVGPEPIHLTDLHSFTKVSLNWGTGTANLLNLNIYNPVTSPILEEGWSNSSYIDDYQIGYNAYSLW